MANEVGNPYFFQTIGERFIGRGEALAVFHRLHSADCDQNGVYYYGQGGSGKTWILRKIEMEIASSPEIQVPSIIDFYDTQNSHLFGLQESIKQRLNHPEAFLQYENAHQQIKAERQKGDKANPSVVAHWDRISNIAFIRGCNQAAQDRKIVLRFDTFERAQNRYVGSWLLKIFLPQVKNLLVVVAGRPAPTPATMPENIASYMLAGLDETEARQYVRKVVPGASDEIIRTIWQRTQGVPLLIELILDLPSPLREDFIKKLDHLEGDQTIQNLQELQRTLVRQFAYPINSRNRIIWAMAFLWRRFDLNVLTYIIRNSEWFRQSDYKAILEDLRHSVYIKEYPDQQSHLLHDEIQRMVSRFVLEEAADPMREMRDPLYKLMVDHFYEEAIQSSNHDLAQQLRAEQLGYILDSSPVEGMAKFREYIEQTEKEHDYDFEELLWSEVRDHLDRLDVKGYPVCIERGHRLQRHSLWERAEEHYEELLQRYTQKEAQIQVRISLGFMLYRQGRLGDARSVYEDCLQYITGPDDNDELSQIENTLGQLERTAGRWDVALKHFNNSFKAARLARNNNRLIDTYINRGFLYSLKGLYHEAMDQCNSAIELLERLPDSEYKLQRLIYAYRNKAIVFRHSESFENALEIYRTSLRIAEGMNNDTAICDISQQIGIAYHLLGRSIRRQENPSPELLEKSLDYQNEAWLYLSRAIDSARISNWLPPIAEGLNRLAKLYREVHHLDNMAKRHQFPAHAARKLSALKTNLASFDNTFELEFQGQLLIPEPFDSLNWLRKCERLFEISALIADQVHDNYRALDSLTETARTLMWAGLLKESEEIIARIDQLRGREGQPEVFNFIAEITKGHLEFIYKEYPTALRRFMENFGHLANSTGYASYMLDDRLRDLEWRLHDLINEDPSLATLWCDTLEEGWDEMSAMERRPDMRHMLERIRLEIDMKLVANP